MSNINYIKCRCEEVFDEAGFHGHFSKCINFKRDFKNFDFKFGEILKEFAEPKENLLIIRFLLNQYKIMIDDKVEKLGIRVAPRNLGMGNHNQYEQNNQNHNFIPNMNNINVVDHNRSQNMINNNQNVSPSINQNVSPSFNQSNNPFENPNRGNNMNHNGNNNMGDHRGNNMNHNVDNNMGKYMGNFPNVSNPRDQNIDFDVQKVNPSNPQKSNFMIEEDDIITCQICHNLDFDYLDCCHPICKDCFFQEANKNFSNMMCKICSSVIEEGMKIQFMQQSKYNEYQEKALKELIGDDVKTCPNCKENFLLDKGRIDLSAKDEKGQKLSEQSAKHYAENRCKCPSCKTEFCIECKKSPYHLGIKI